MFCKQALLIMRLFKKSRFSNTFKIRTINTLLTNNIVVNHHLIVEINTRTIVEMMIIQKVNIRIDETNFEMNFEIDQMINFKIVVRKDVLYVRNLIIDQSIIQKTSATTRKSAFSIDIHSSETIIVFVNTF